MRTKQEIEERIAQHERDLVEWAEPMPVLGLGVMVVGGLVATEPDPEEREIVRRELKAAILVLKWALGGAGF